MLDDLRARSADGICHSKIAAGGNRLIASLTTADRDRLAVHLRPDVVAPGQILFEPDRDVAEVVFPFQGTVFSLLEALPGRKPVETASVGYEGAVGALFGPDPGTTTARCTALTGGGVLRISAARFGEALDASPTLRAQMGRYAMALFGQVQHGVACAALLTVEARAGAWMLALLDRLGDRSLPVTQEVLADLLGVRRTTITRVVATLEARGVIRHRRSRIIVVDRAGLEMATGDGYRRLRARFEQAAPGLYPSPTDGLPEMARRVTA